MKKLIIVTGLIATLSSYVFANDNNYFLNFNTEDFQVSDYLVEGKIEYSAKCLSSNDELPWVPKNSNDASIVIKNCDTKDIVISSGYVSKNKKDLYEKNARPKTIRIEYLKSKDTKTVELKDTSEPQVVNLFSPQQASEKVRLVFVENYAGSKYSDLCINYICKAVCKREPTDSRKDFDSIEFETNRLPCSTSIWESNLKLLSGQNVIHIYRNNNFPEVKLNGFIINFDIKMQYCEIVKCDYVSADEIKITFGCDSQRETFILNVKEYKAVETEMKNFYPRG